MSETYRKLREDKLRLSQIKNPDSAKQLAQSSASAVPTPKTGIEKEYEQFKMCFELDVVVTIEKDLEDEAMKEK